MAELIVALDFPKAAPALAMAEKLRPTVRWFKVGLELFISAGPGIVNALKDLAASVFLDLKLYDIPNTAAQAALACARLKADMLTIHCQGGLAMCEAVAKILRPLPQAPLILGVTVLTSFRADQMPGVKLNPESYALELSQIAVSAGLYGIVCSAAEALALKARNPGLACVCPGIRLFGTAANDQARIVTPGQAVLNGADYLVVGRPITQANDPCLMATRIIDEMKLG